MTPDFLTPGAGGHSTPGAPGDAQTRSSCVTRRISSTVVSPASTLSAPSSRSEFIPLAVRRAPDGGGVRRLHDQVADLVVDDQELVDAGPAAVAGLLALGDSPGRSR